MGSALDDIAFRLIDGVGSIISLVRSLVVFMPKGQVREETERPTRTSNMLPTICLMQTSATLLAAS